MRSQALILEAIVVFIAVVVVLLLAAPLHFDTSWAIRGVEEADANQVARLLD